MFIVMFNKMFTLKCSFKLQMIALALAAMSVGCATTGTPTASKFDPQAAEKARPFLANHYALDFRYASTGGVCAEPKGDADWKAWVLATSACVQKQDFASVEKFGASMVTKQSSSPWGAYFLGVAAANRGEVLRAHWMLDLAEKKAGGPIGLVRYEKARILEKEEGTAEAAKEMKQAIKLDSTLMPGFLWLAQVHHRDRMNSEAETYYREAIALKPDMYSAIVGLSEIMIENKNGSEAADLLTRAIALRPEVAETRVKLASVYEALTKEPGKALQTLRELRVALDKGRARGKTGMDLGVVLGVDINAKIKTIEQTIKPEPTGQAREREPASKGNPASQKKGG